ncbi:uncharacterized protein LOC129766614 [Toxorhynchites rutilus septentrionalis]|uniref:uncharacterized protein LOC129766614 n=1 Tax=Toxorhynchites rutilus septentrionalis TaxID=329112 RepID=UPI00247AAB33|nr:uncharacterized protein LOC129766614 [Toxorhynchites rutilus septentrionalis]
MAANFVIIRSFTHRVIVLVLAWSTLRTHGPNRTPNHFLLGNSSGVRQPVVEVSDSASALRSNWNHIQHLLDIFWRRWTREYLPTLTRRPKWCGEAKPIVEGQLVLVVGDGRRNEWTRGRIIQTIKGSDGRIRQAIIQTARGLVRRPVARLAVLEVEESGKTEPGGQYYGGEDVDTGSTSGNGMKRTTIDGSQH